MTQYKGFYIDHVVYNSREEIDAAIKAGMIKKVQTLARMMSEYSDPGMIMATCKMLSDTERTLMQDYGMTAAEIEEIELAA
jgi:hypothetical protein